ncbi:MAG TPA: hydroxyphenylacetyl-CoA thioesterase PaaI [Aliiroseovarius sp.]|nr:hydroxyphenylacetyl-CoA thioesterase PaaI [Aliiroseovarius sp.]
MNDQQRAEHVGQVLQARDRSGAGLGISLVRIAPGQAVFEMSVQAGMVNGHGVCHGGYLFLLADTAFGYAANSHNRNMLAQQNSITYLAPAKLGEVLRAEAREVSRSGRSGVYDVRVTGADGRQVALFRGLGRELGGQVFDERAS